jgi:predicted GNAT family N-acyltransferase
VPSDSIKIFETSWSQSSKEISKVRHNVFVVEQSVPSEIEMDGKDSDCIHFLALEKSKPIGAARLQKYGKIERVSVLREYRSKGIGTAIMKRVIESAMDLNVEKIYLHSQMDSKIFYQRLGFIELGQIFYEANIPHIEMILK